MRIKCQKTFLAGALALSLASLQAQAALVHRYSFDSTDMNSKVAQDSVGGVNGTLRNNAFMSDGVVYLNQGTTILTSSDNGGDYVDFPTNFLAGATNLTLDFWFHGGDLNALAVGNWARIFDFGSTVNNNGQSYIYYAPHSGATPVDNRVCINNGNGEALAIDSANGACEGDPDYHVTAVFDITTHYMELYRNGIQTARTYLGTNYSLTNITYQSMWLGRSHYGADSYFNGTINEFRIYNHSFTAPDVMANDLASATSTTGTVANQLGTISAVNFTAGTAISIVERASTNVIPTADFSNAGTVTATGIPLFRYSGYNLISSDTNYVTVDVQGNVYGVKPGTANLTASIGGKTAVLTVTVTIDSTALTVTSVVNAGYDRLLNITFSKPLNTNSAQTLSNYSIDNGAIAVKSATLLPNNVVRLITANFDQTVAHTLAISGVQDLAFTPNIMAATNASFGFSQAIPATGCTRKYWTNQSSYAAFKSNPNFPYAPDSVSFLTSAQGPVNDNLSNYGDVLEGYIVPSTSGNYYFAIATDDEGDLYVSTDDNPLHVGSTPISSVSGWAGSLQFSSYVSKTTIAMVAGQKYFFQLNHHQGGGGDNAEIAMSTSSGIVNGAAPIQAANLVPYIDKAIAMSISAQPQSLSIYQGQDATFSIGVGSIPAPTSYQWYRNGQSISNATSTTYTLPLVQKATDDGAQFYCVASNLVDCVTSAVVNLSITIDLVNPVLVKATGSGLMNSATVSFSKRMMPSTVTNKANYTITSSSGALTITSITLDSTYTNVTIVTSKQTAETVYTVTLNTNNITDLAGNKIVNGGTATFTGFDYALGYTYVKYYDNYTAGVDSLYAYTQTNSPTRTAVLNGLGFPNFNDPGIYNFGALIEGYIIPPASGDYFFYIASDDASRVFLSTDDTPAHLSATDICHVNGWSPWGNFTQDSATGQQSAPQTLTAGQRYFYRVTWCQGGGGAGFLLAWSGPNDNGTIETNVPSSTFAVAIDPTLSSVQFVQQPVSVTILQGGKASFNVNATGTYAIGTNVTYQWRRNGAAITNATGTNYTIPVVQASDSGAFFDCVATVPFATATSSKATLTVTLDKAPPTVLSAAGFTGSTVLGVRFDKPVTPAAAGLTYTIPGYTVQGVEFRTNSMLDGTNGDMVVLTLNNPIAAGKSVTVAAGLTDRWGNVSSKALTVPVGICTMGAQDLSISATDPLFAGITVPTDTNAFQIIAGGSDIWNANDSCQFVYTTFTGDLDVRARVANISMANGWSKSGIMVRTSLDSGAAEVYQVVTPTDPGAQNTWASGYRAAYTNGASDFPDLTVRGGRVANPSYPNAWVRITRADNVFTAYSSTNGTDWHVDGVVDLSTNGWPSQVYAGICVTAHDNSGGTTNTTTDVYDFTVTSYTPPATPPTLTAVCVGTSVKISWDATLGEGYTLVAADDPKGTWNAVSGTPVTSGSTSTMTVPATGTKKFYQLKK